MVNSTPPDVRSRIQNAFLSGDWALLSKKPQRLQVSLSLTEGLDSALSLCNLHLKKMRVETEAWKLNKLPKNQRCPLIIQMPKHPYLSPLGSFCRSYQYPQKNFINWAWREKGQLVNTGTFMKALKIVYFYVIFSTEIYLQCSPK